ncbi:TIM barrel protein [filamentous cyanobacterium LEGE 11480]|uniref:TIM barrel protein n=1 Tax=Romeriopsis navalis LEGE 11480 TaxID=2777977 RepID=A0A928Z2I1_9CYAN|nr:TIM barrel protein [Romeriopsis navalis LEGE 11480]
MELLVLRSIWSGPESLEPLLQQTVDAGFNGIEGPIPDSPTARREWQQQLQDHNLAFIAEATTGSDKSDSGNWWIPKPERSLQDHLDDLRWTIEYAAAMDALFVSAMTGYDAWSWQQNVDFFSQALELQQQSGITISFETHRSRSLFNPWITRDLLQQFPQMQITCDFSHWCVVCERLIDSEWEILQLCASRARHIHSRVGFAQHAQVSEPRAPEYQAALIAHERWWDLIWQSQKLRGLPRTTMTPEFLWDNYMSTLPFTQQPVADVWQITCWMAERQRQRFAQLGKTKLGQTQVSQTPTNIVQPTEHSRD